jgi:DNA segregation ATPase FtsK/SpoIIIE-like protein
MATQERWEQLASANDDIDAQLLVGVLADAGIETRLVKNRSGYGDYLYGGSNPWAPVEVHVHQHELAEARRIVEEQAAPSAPESDSDTSSSEDSSERRSYTTVIAVAIVALIVLSFLLEQRASIF